MGGLAFAGPLTIGAALIAVWIDLRLGSKRPATPLRRFVHAGIGFGALQVGSAVAAHVGNGAPRGQVLIAIFLLLFPSLVYAFLGGAWLIRTLAEAARVAGR